MEAMASLMQRALLKNIFCSVTNAAKPGSLLTKGTVNWEKVGDVVFRFALQMRSQSFSTVEICSTTLHE